MRKLGIAGAALGSVLTLTGCEKLDCANRNARALSVLVEDTNIGACDMSVDDSTLHVVCDDAELIGDSRLGLSLLFFGDDIGFELDSSGTTFRCADLEIEVTDPETLAEIGRQIRLELSQLEVD